MRLLKNKEQKKKIKSLEDSYPYIHQVKCNKKKKVSLSNVNAGDKNCNALVMILQFQYEDKVMRNLMPKKTSNESLNMK